MEICDYVTFFIKFVHIVTMCRDWRRVRLFGNVNCPHSRVGVAVAVEGERWIVVVVDRYGCAGK